MWSGIIENFHLSCDKLRELETLENLVMGETGVNAYTLQPLAHYAKLFTLEIRFNRSDKEENSEARVVYESAFNYPREVELLCRNGSSVFGAAEFIRHFEDLTHAHLFGFYVCELLQGSGAAGELLNACENHLNSFYKILTIDLSVSESNGRAVAFYLKHGYMFGHKAPDYYGTGRGRLIMHKRIGRCL